MGKSIFLPTQHYDIPYLLFKKIFVVILVVDLNVIRNQQWNVERAAIFHTFIFQSIRLVSAAKNIHERITSRLNFWNTGAYSNLVQDSYGAATDYLGKECGIQNQD